jgi:hypothetical protein
MTGAKLRRTGLPAHTWCLNTKSNGRINRTVKGVGHECPTHDLIVLRPTGLQLYIAQA